MAYIDTCRFASLEEAITGIEIPEFIRETLALETVPFFSFDGAICSGQLVIHQELAEEVRGIFNILYRMRFPIASIIPASAFGWSDDASMLANNTSAFNLRYKNVRHELSEHAKAWALDINPMLNPCLDHRTGSVAPAGAQYDPFIQGTLTKDSPVVALFRSYGWVWGGDWTSLHDYMHFEKRLDGLLS